MSPKQAVYQWLIHHGFVELRMRESHAVGGSWWWLFRHRRRFCGYGVALANLLHRLHETVLQPEFTETDLGFLNHAVPRFLQQVGDEANTGLVAMLVQLSEADLQRKCESADGSPMTTWKLLRAMVEHEIHHRGELYAALGALGVRVPPLYGLSSEQLRTIAAGRE